MKSLFKSKTFWFNVLAIMASVAGQSAGLIQDPATQALVISGANIALRVITKEKVSLTAGG